MKRPIRDYGITIEQDCQFYKEKLTISEKIRKLLENDFQELM